MVPGLVSDAPTKLNPTGSGLVYSTYLGGSGTDRIGIEANGAIALDAAGNAYGTLIQGFAVKWQAGHAGDLHKGLQNLDKQIDAQLKQAKAGGVP